MNSLSTLLLASHFYFQVFLKTISDFRGIEPCWTIVQNHDHYTVCATLISKATTLHRKCRDNCEKRFCSGSHKQFKTLFKDHMVRFKIISVYIHKYLRLTRILGLMSHVITSETTSLYKYILK